MKPIIRLIYFLAATMLLASLFVNGLVGEEKVPAKIVFESKMGAVTFDHAKHGERANSDCTTCHDKLFPQSKAPLNFKGGMHKPAEAAKTSCAACHHAGGNAFETKGNCTNCHVKGK